MKQLDTLIGKPLTLRECLIVIEIIVIVIVFVIIIVTVVVIVIVINEIKQSFKDQKPNSGRAASGLTPLADGCLALTR